MQVLLISIQKCLIFCFNLGLGLGSTYLCASVAVTYYFDRYRGAAFGMAAAGNGLGYIVVPVFLSSLSSYFGTDLGWRRCVLVFSIISTGITLLCGLTFRPIEIEALTENEIQEMEMKLDPPASHLETVINTQMETISETETWKMNVGG